MLPGLLPLPGNAKKRTHRGSDPGDRPRVKRGNKKAVQQPALDLGTVAQIKNLHKRLHFPESDAKSHTVRVGDIRAAWGL